MTAKNICILGASGSVGTQMIECLEEQDVDVKNLKLLASKKSAGRCLLFKGEEVEIQEATENSFKDVDVVLGAAENDIAKRFVPIARDCGAITVDNSSYYRLDERVPLVVADVNDDDIAAHSGIIANPNCATIIAMLAIYPLHKLARAKRMIVSTYQAASGAGINGLKELEAQIKQIAEGKDGNLEHRAFDAQLAMNLIPQIGGFQDNFYTSEELKMQNEGRKILHDENLRVNCTCVRVPIARSHSESITIEFEDKIDITQAREALSHFKCIKLIDDIEDTEATNRYPMPLYSSNQDLVMVGRLRRDISSEEPNKTLTLWCCGDQIRIGAASNAVKIVKKLTEK